MNTHFDWKKRVVSVANLEAMCERISGMSHRYWVESVSRSRVKVGYSNPNEYGSEDPMYAVFPCYPNGFEKDNPAVVLDMINCINDRDGYGYQAFDVLLDCPTLWRRNAEDKEWRSHKEIRDAGNDGRKDLPDTCTICDIKK